MYIMIGMPSKDIVSFTKNAESVPIPTTNTIRRVLRSLSPDNIRMATSFSTPDMYVECNNDTKHSKKKSNDVEIN